MRSELELLRSKLKKSFEDAESLYKKEVEGETNQRFDLDSFDGVRGYNDAELGRRKALASIELRYPFIENLKLGFPLPLNLVNIRGSAFMDIGAVWDDEVIFAKNGYLNDLKMGFGFGPRINLGYFILKFDIAWETDLQGISEPSYYFILSPDF